MNYIYIKTVSYDFLLQAVKILHTNQNDKYELDIVYDFIIQLTDETLLSYMEKKTIISYDNDFDLFMELIDRLIEILEDEKYEEYEKCYLLLNKKEYCKKLLTNLV
jgi:hypothetical protein